MVDRSFDIRSSKLPAGSLLEAYFHRDVVRLSDRGGASGMIGDRWSDLVAAEIASWPGRNLQLPHVGDVHIERSVRMDEIPSIARVASKRKLQNPDFVVLATRSDGSPVLFAVDSKFSVETAKAPQVSADVLQALLDVGPLITDHLGDFPDDVEVQDGLFLSPDYELSHYMFSRRRGMRSVSAPHDQFLLLKITPAAFFQGMEGAQLISMLALVDQLDRQVGTNLLAALYEFRVARAIIGCWQDHTAPLLGKKITGTPDIEAITAQTATFAERATSAWDIVVQWDSLAERSRRRRDAINHVTQLPVINRDLRSALETAAKDRGVTAPSLNSVRRRLGMWYVGAVTEEVGQVPHDVDDFNAVMERLVQVTSRLRALVPDASTRAIHAALDEQPAAEHERPRQD